MGNICSESEASGDGGSSATADNKILTDQGIKPLTNNQLKHFNAFFNMLFVPLPGMTASLESLEKLPIIKHLMAPGMYLERERNFNQADLDFDGKLTKA